MKWGMYLPCSWSSEFPSWVPPHGVEEDVHGVGAGLGFWSMAQSADFSFLLWGQIPVFCKLFSKLTQLSEDSIHSSDFLIAIFAGDEPPPDWITDTRLALQVVRLPLKGPPFFELRGQHIHADDLGLGHLFGALDGCRVEIVVQDDFSFMSDFKPLERI